MIACLAQLDGSLELLVSWLHSETVQLLLMSWLNTQAGKMISIQVSAHAHPVQLSVATTSSALAVAKTFLLSCKATMRMSLPFMTLSTIHNNKKIRQ